MASDPRRLQEFALDITKGVLVYEEPSQVPGGFVTELVNWIPEPTGALRARVGWTATAGVSADANPLPSVRATRNLLAYSVDGDYELVALALDNDELQLWTIAVDNLDTAWNYRATNTITAVEHPGAMAVAFGKVFYCHPGLESLRVWDGTTEVNVNDSVDAPVAGRAMAFHKNRLFIGGAYDAGGTYWPSRVWYSSLDGADDATEWSATSDVDTQDGYFDVDADDDLPIECLLPWDNGLLIGKRSGVWFLGGDGPNSFQVVRIPGEANCAPGQSLCATPYGALIIGVNHMWLFAGGPPQPISQAIEPDYQLSESWVSTAYIDGRGYVSDAAHNTLWVWSPVGITTSQGISATASQCWHTEQMVADTDRISALMIFDSTLYAGRYGGDGDGLAVFRSLPQRDRVRDYGTDEQTFAMTSPELWLGGDRPFTLRHIDLRIKQRSDAAEVLSIVATVDGTEQEPRLLNPQTEAKTYRQRIDFGDTGYAIKLRFEYLATHDPIDLEQITLRCSVEGYR